MTPPHVDNGWQSTLAPPPTMVPPAHLTSAGNVAVSAEPGWPQAEVDPSNPTLPVSLSLPPQPAVATASAADVAAALAGSVLAGLGPAMPMGASAEGENGVASDGAATLPAGAGVEPAAPAAPSAGTPCCTQGHRLVFAKASQALHCDVCGTSVAEGDMAWSCEPCDFDQCSNCAKAQA